MTLREEVLRSAGVLEEGKFKNFLIGSLIVAAAAFAAVKGYPVAKQVKTAVSTSAYDKYRDADRVATYRDIKGEPRTLSTNIRFNTFYNNLKNSATLTIHLYMSSYGDYIVTDKINEARVEKMIENEVLDQIDVYIKSLKDNSSKLEKYIKKDNYIGDDSLKVNLDFVLDIWRDKDGNDGGKQVKEFCKNIAPELSRKIAKELGIDTNSVVVYVGNEKVNIR